MGGKGGLPLRRLAAFDGLRMVKVSPVAIFCRKEKALSCGMVGRSLRHSARPVATCQEFLTPYFYFVQMHKILKPIDNR